MSSRKPPIPTRPTSYSLITALFRAFCASQMLRIISTGADKHGALVWEAGQPGQTNRYISLALAEEGPRSKPRYDAELWIGADDNKRFANMLITSWKFDHNEAFELWQRLVGIDRRDVDEWYGQAEILRVKALAISSTNLLTKLFGAWEIASGLRAEEFTEEYITPRIPLEELLRSTGPQ